MSCSRIVPTFAFFLALSSSVALAQFPLGGGNNMFRQMVVQQAQQELTCLKIVTGVTDEQSATILENLDELIDESSADMAKALQSGDTNAAPAMAKTLQDAVGVEAKQILKPKALEAYEADVALRQKIQRRGAQRAVLSAMDGLLQLSNKQQGSMAKILMSSWDDEWNGAGIFGGGGMGSIVLIKDTLKNLPQDELKDNLRDSQWEALNSAMDVAPAATMTDPLGLAESQGKAVSKLKIEETIELCKLSEDQGAKLKEALDTSLANAIERRKAAMEALKGGNIQANVTVIQDLSRPLDQMLFTDEAWTAAIDDVLNAEQSKTYAARQKSREKRNKSTMIAALATGMGMQAGGVTGKQQVEMAKLFDKHLSKLPADPMQQAMAMNDIPEEEFQKVLNEDQWKKLSTMLNQMKQLSAGKVVAPAAQ